MAIGMAAMAAMSLAPMLLKGILGRGRVKGRGKALRGGRRKTPKRHQVKKAWVKAHRRHHKR